MLLPTTPLTEVIQALSETPLVFVRSLGQVGGMITRGDLQDPPVRMWLFGLVTAIELRFHDLIEEHLPEAAWAQYLSPERTGKAKTPARGAQPARAASDIARLPAVCGQGPNHRTR